MSGEYSIGFYVGCKLECITTAYTYIRCGEIYESTDIMHDKNTVEILLSDGTKMEYPAWCFKLAPEFTYFNPKIDYFKINREVANI